MPGLRQQQESAVVAQPDAGLMGQTNAFQAAIVRVEEKHTPAAVGLRDKGGHGKGELREGEGVAVGIPRSGTAALLGIDILDIPHDAHLAVHFKVVYLSRFYPIRV